MSLLIDIGTYLKAKGIITDDGVDYFRDHTPSSDDDVLSAIQYDGIPDKGFEESVIVFVQFNSCAKTYRDARAKAYELYKEFIANPGELWLTTTRYAIVTPQQPPFKKTIDANQRIVFTFNTSIVTTRDVD